MTKHSTNLHTQTIMKRILSLIILCTALLNAHAQRSYVTVFFGPDSNESIKLSGAIPASMKDTYIPYYDFGQYNVYLCIGEVLNQLAANGFEVDKLSTTTCKNKVYTTYLLSKPTSGTGVPTAIEKQKSDDVEEAREVARYNLQGHPVEATEKGLQIVVYSNYTTRTVIVE